MTRERAAELLSDVTVLDDPEMAEAHRVAISALRQQEPVSNRNEPLTNVQKIRYMSDEELAEFLLDFNLADVAPVVRCKNCKYSCKDGTGRTCEGYWYELSAFAVPVEDDGFCSYGKRKEGAE